MKAHIIFIVLSCLLTGCVKERTASLPPTTTPEASTSPPTGGIPTPAPGSSIGWPEDLEPGQPYLQALPESICQGEPIHLRAFQFTPGDWVGLSMQTADQVVNLSERLQIDGATQAHFFLESDSYPPGDYTLTLRSHALNMQAEAKIIIREACIE